MQNMLLSLYFKFSFSFPFKYDLRKKQIVLMISENLMKIIKKNLLNCTYHLYVRKYNKQA